MSKRNRILILIVVILIGAGLFFTQITLSNNANTKSVAFDTVTKKDLVQTITATGIIDTGKSQTITLPFTQKVKRILVKEGSMVRKGQTIILMDTSDINSQLAKLKISLDMAKMNLANAQGDGGALQKLSASNAVKQAQLSLNNAQNNYDDSVWKEAEYKKKYDAGQITEEIYRSIKSAKEMASNQLSLAKISLANAKASLKSSTNTSENSLKTLKLQLSNAQSDYNSLLNKISDSKITANISGKIVSLKVKTGAYPDQTNAQIIINDTDSYKLSIALDQTDAIKIKLNQKAIVKISGLDKKYEGKVTYISSTATSSLSAGGLETKLKIDITFDRVDENIKPGFEADADIILKETKNVLAVNFDATTTDSNGTKYLFLNKLGKAVKTTVTTGAETDFDVEILTGVKEGDVYVSNPPTGLKNGDSIKLEVAK